MPTGNHGDNHELTCPAVCVCVASHRGQTVLLASTLTHRCPIPRNPSSKPGSARQPTCRVDMPCSRCVRPGSR